MKKKYLTTDAIEAVEFELLAGAENFTAMLKEKKEEKEEKEKRKKISYKEFKFPQFISQEAIEEELNVQIKKLFAEECEGKVILLNYSVAEELRYQQIIMENKKEYNL